MAGYGSYEICYQLKAQVDNPLCTYVSANLQCGICFGLAPPAVETECGHLFGESCIQQWFSHAGSNARCPSCRAILCVSVTGKGWRAAATAQRLVDMAAKTAARLPAGLIDIDERTKALYAARAELSRAADPVRNAAAYTELAKLASGDDDGYAHETLAEMIECGRTGGAHGSDTAMMHYEMAADCGHPYARGQLARLLMDKHATDPDSARRGYLLAEAASRDGDAMAHAMMGRAYRERICGVPCIPALAAWHYAASATGGVQHAMVVYGDMLRTGVTGVPRNHERAIHWYRRAMAADQSARYIHGRIGFCAFYGLGTPRDEAAGRAMLKVACDAGDPYALFEMSRVCFRFPRDAADQDAARKYLEKAVEVGYQRAISLLGGFYMDGEYYPRDIQKARELLGRIASRDVRARSRLQALDEQASAAGAASAAEKHERDDAGDTDEPAAKRPRGE